MIGVTSCEAAEIGSAQLPRAYVCGGDASKPWNGISADESLDGGDVLPGFVLPLAEFLDKGRRPRQSRG
jgi:hypothetical protein